MLDEATVKQKYNLYWVIFNHFCHSKKNAELIFISSWTCFLPNTHYNWSVFQISQVSSGKWPWISSLHPLPSWYSHLTWHSTTIIPLWWIECDCFLIPIARRAFQIAQRILKHSFYKWKLKDKETKKQVWLLYILESFRRSRLF